MVACLVRAVGTVSERMGDATMTTGTITAGQGTAWDEPPDAHTARGWLHTREHCVGFYLDYGPEHYRTPHASELNTINGPLMRVWCRPGDLCRTCQPGNILACRYPSGPGEEPRESRYVVTVAEARRYVETGTV